MRRIKKLELLFYILVPVISGSIIGLLAIKDYDYLNTLNRTIIVPNYIFPIVWTILYILMGIWAYKIVLDNKDEYLRLYYIQLILNLLFTPVLFTAHRIILATIIVISLIVIITYLIHISFKNKKKYGYLLVPYIIWLICAFVLMLDLIINNLIYTV